MNFKNFFVTQMNFGVNLTSNIIYQKKIQKINSISFGLSLNLLFLLILNIIQHNPFLIRVSIINFLIVFCNYAIFRIFKNVKLYFILFALVLSYLTIDVLISGGYHGEGLIVVCLAILGILNTSGIKYGSFIILIILLVEIFIFKFHSKIDWIYTYPPELEILFLRFFIIQLSIFFINFLTIRRHDELYIQVQEDKERKAKLFLNIVHDLKTPLTMIHNNVDQIISGKNNEKTRKILKSNINKMEKDILNILNLNRLQKGFHTYDRDIVTNISILTFDTCKIFSNYAQSRGIKIVTKVKSNVYVRIDQGSYTEVLNNLLENAIKYTSSGGLISVNVNVENSSINLIVEDTGIGIDQNKLNSIFDSYFQADDSYESYYGLGIGLTITKEICEIWGGTITVNSIKGEGSIFTVSFPIPSKNITTYSTIKELKNPLNSNFSEIKIPEFNEELQTILIVEDNLDIRNLLIESFSGLYNLKVAINGEDALKQYTLTDKIDLIITDLMMPIMDGKEFITSLSKKIGGLTTPVIVLTAKSDEENSLEYLALGAIDFLSKPFSITELLAKVESVLRVFKNKQDGYIENINSNLISFLSEKCNIKSNIIKPVINYKKLRKYSVTSKEQCMIEHINNGLSYKEIAYEENISVNTVKTHIYRIYKKCSVNNYSSLIELFYTT